MTPILGIMASQISGHLSNTAYESISTVTVGGGGAASVTFSSIAADWTHLQLRIISRDNRAAWQSSVNLQFNSDSSAVYAQHFLIGNGASASAGNDINQTQMVIARTYGASASANTFGASVTDILDYANTNKFKTLRTLSGAEANSNNADGFLWYNSGLWRSTDAVTRIDLTPNGTLWSEYSQFALYGIKGA
jgi:hypothetical protein